MFGRETSQMSSVRSITGDRGCVGKNLTCMMFSAAIAFLLLPFVEGFSVLHESQRSIEVSKLQTRLLSKDERSNAAAADGDNEIDTPPMELPSMEESASFEREELQSLTVSALKQQLRLRGMQVSGRKAELVDRLLTTTRQSSFSLFDESDEEENKISNSEFLSAEEMAVQKMKARRNIGGVETDLVDVTAYLDESDVGKDTLSSASPDTENIDLDEDSPMQEVWGQEARLMADTEDERVVVDSLSRTTIEYKGSNQTYVQAVVVATREALRPFLSGAGSNQTLTTVEATEQRLKELQEKREKESAVPLKMEDSVGLDEGDETKIFKDVLNREYSDWGKYTVTGAQLSAQEVQGVLLLSDVFGPFTADVTALAEKIAFECQPVIAMIPDLFRGNPWMAVGESQLNEKGQTYEQWRATHSDLRVSVDIRAAAACMRETYGVSSIAVWGTCYGGGRALEAASGWMESVHDVDGETVGPPPVDPLVAVAWYPTRYDAQNLFGKEHGGMNVAANGKRRKCAVMGVFAELDGIAGATTSDATALKQLLSEDDRIVDHMIKVFPGQQHGFAHLGLGKLLASEDDGDDLDKFAEEEFKGAGRLAILDGDAEVACLLSTAFMETYSRVFLPTVGPPISLDEREHEWSENLNMKDLSESNDRDIRKEMEDATGSFVEEPLLSGPRIDPTDKSQEDALANLLRSMENPNENGKFKIEDDDDLPTIYGKLTASDENFQIF